MPDPLVHWPGLPEQERFIPPSEIRRPARCGEAGSPLTLTWQRELLTCPACAQLVAEDKEGGQRA